MAQEREQELKYEIQFLETQLQEMLTEMQRLRAAVRQAHARPADSGGCE